MDELDELRAATDTAKEVIHQAHEAIKDLRSCMREFEELINRRADRMVTDRLEQEYRAGLDMLGSTVDVATRRIYRRFDKIEKLLLGGPDEADAVDVMAANFVRKIRHVTKLSDGFAGLTAPPFLPDSHPLKRR